MTAIIIEVYCVFCKKKNNSTLIEVKSGTSEKGKKYNMAKGKCIQCEKSTCMILSQKGADEYNEKLQNNQPNETKSTIKSQPNETKSTTKKTK